VKSSQSQASDEIKIKPWWRTSHLLIFLSLLFLGFVYLSRNNNAEFESKLER
jgi:hypothetical protein